jgi:transposase
MAEVTTIGLDLAKNVFQAHGASASGAVAFRKKLRRNRMLTFFAAQPRCLVAMEACASAHYWARELTTGSTWARTAAAWRRLISVVPWCCVGKSAMKR